MARIQNDVQLRRMLARIDENLIAVNRRLKRLETWAQWGVLEDEKPDDGPALIDGLWSGRPAFVIGGGPSLKGFDWSLLEGHLCIGVNRAIEAIEPAILWTMDHRFLRNWVANGCLGERFDNALAAANSLKVAREQEGCPLPPGWKGIRRSPERWTASIEHGISNVGNSGFTALHLACLLGADPIYLLGIDMRGAAGKQQWWHGDYPVVKTEDEAFSQIIRFFEEYATPNLGGRQVINLSQRSALECFPKAGFDAIPEATTPLFVSMYTPNDHYPQLAERLRKSLTRWGMRHQITAQPDLGDWTANCSQKAEVIQRALVDAQSPIVWVDADAILRRFPHELCAQAHEPWDIACHFLRREGRDPELLSGTLAFNQTPGATLIVARWSAECSKRRDEWDQRVLQEIIENSPDIRVKHLPPEYCMIHDTMRSQCPDGGIIEHFQASREVRRSKRQV